MRVSTGLWPLILLFALVWGPVAAQEDDLDELVAQEKLRASIETIFDDYFQPGPGGDARQEMATTAALAFAEIGPDAAPFLINELEAELPQTFELCALALGYLATPEGNEALRAAALRANDEDSHAARERKALAAWALGFAGEPTALRLLSEGRHQVTHHSVHSKMSVAESIALATAPDSIPILLELLEQVTDDADRWQMRRALLRALRRVADASVIPKLLPLQEHEDRNVRRELSWTLHMMPTDEARAAVGRALGDDDFTVRRTSALALEQLGIGGLRERVLERLGVEEDPVVRGPLYRALAEAGLEDGFELLSSFAGREDVNDRRPHAEAVGLLDDARRTKFLAAALHDEKAGVALQAIHSLALVGDEAAIAALREELPKVTAAVARSISDELARLEIFEAGPAIADRIVAELAADPPLGRSAEIAVERMGVALRRLLPADAAPKLKKAIEGRDEPRVTGQLEETIRLLELARANKKKVARWVESAASEDAAVRELAFRQLGRIGGSAATAALVSAFDAAETADRLRILDATGYLSEKEAKPLLRRLLLEPEFKGPADGPLRDMAAWAARRIGGAAMWELLREAALQRDGRDVRVLIYAAQLDGERTLPLLDELRQPRMRYLGWQLGNELERLDWIALRLRSGRSIRKFDLRPERIMFR